MSQNRGVFGIMFVENLFQSQKFPSFDLTNLITSFFTTLELDKIYIVDKAKSEIFQMSIKNGENFNY